MIWIEADRHKVSEEPAKLHATEKVVEDIFAVLINVLGVLEAKEIAYSRKRAVILIWERAWEVQCVGWQCFVGPTLVWNFDPSFIFHSLSKSAP